MQPSDILRKKHIRNIQEKRHASVKEVIGSYHDTEKQGEASKEHHDVVQAIVDKHNKMLKTGKGGRRRKTNRKLWFRRKTARKHATRKSGSYLGSTAGHSALASMGIPMGF